ncbi:MAG: hypothetical protein Kow0077_12930 [Anaerolineae bacterium]
MSLPYELTTFPKGAIEIIRFLGEQDGYAAFDEDILAATDLSERAYGKAIRRLVTREYIEMQFDGSYTLTETGIEAAEAIAAYDAEAGFDDEAVIEGEEEAFIELLEINRPVTVVYPRLLAAGQPAYVFLRVDGAANAEDALPVPVDLLFEVQDSSARGDGELDVIPEQVDATVPEKDPAEAARFEVIAPAPGTYTLQVVANQVTQTELMPVGELVLHLTAVESVDEPRFLKTSFPVTLQPGL